MDWSLVARLRDVASLVRSKNAGPFLLTLDVLFRRREDFDRAVQSQTLSDQVVAHLYGLQVEDVRFFICPECLAFKATFARDVPSGGPFDSDVYGAQQHAPLLDLEIPDEVS